MNNWMMMQYQKNGATPEHKEAMQMANDYIKEHDQGWMAESVFEMSREEVKDQKQYYYDTQNDASLDAATALQAAGIKETDPDYDIKFISSVQALVNAVEGDYESKKRVPPVTKKQAAKEDLRAKEESQLPSFEARKEYQDFHAASEGRREERKAARKEKLDREMSQ